MRAQRILYIDDHSDSAEMMSLLLSYDQPHYKVITAKTAEEARKFRLWNDFDLYILDIFLPDENGIPLCREIRADDISVPIIFYTAMSAPSYRENALAAGASLFLVKPNDLDELRPAIHRLLLESAERTSDGAG